MKFKKVFCFALTALMMTGCANGAEPTVSKEKTFGGAYSVTYSITAANDIAYENTYTVETVDGRLIISSVAEKETDGEVQTITTENVLCYDDTEYCTFGMPISQKQEFTNTADKTQYTSFTFEHDHKIKSGSLKTKKYSSSEETGYKETLYTVTLADKYYDKDTLAFIASAFNENEGVIKLSSGNRDKLQTVRYERLDDVTVETECGSYLCACMRIRPNTAFSVNYAYIYYDSETGIPVKVVHDESEMVLSSDWRK